MKKTHALFFAAVILTGCEKITTLTGEAPLDAIPETVPDTPKIVAWLTLGETTGRDKRFLSGLVSAAETTRLAFESSGQIKTIAVKLGQQFHQGQKLATLDDSDYRLQLQQAEANYTAAVAARDQARTDLRRHERLLQSGAVSKAQVEAYRLQLKSVQETVNTADAQVKLAKSRLYHTDLIAPFDGVIVAQSGEIGQFVGIGTAVFTVAASQAPEVSISVPENFMASVKHRQRVTVTFPARADIRPVSGTISAISVQAALGAFPVKITLENAPAEVQSGMTAEVSLPQAVTLGGFNIPLGALGAGQHNRHFVYRITEKNTNLLLEKIMVNVENLSGNQVRIYSEQLKKGDKIVRSGWRFLNPNQSVALMNVGTRLVNP